MSRPHTFDWNQASLSESNNLPHLRQENVIYFVTFRLADSLPFDRVQELKEQRDFWLRKNPAPHSYKQELEYRRIWTARLEGLLDAGHGQCVLRDPSLRSLVETTIRHDDLVSCRLGDFVIMPNHVHVLLQVIQGHELSRIVKGWKSITARRLAQNLRQHGSIWMTEYFDHCVRNDEQLHRLERYIRKNPRHLPTDTYTLGKGSLSV